MNNSKNPTGLNGRKELKVNLSEEFDMECNVGAIVCKVDGTKVVGKIKPEKTMKIKCNFKDMKPAGKLRPQTREMVEDRVSQKQADEAR